MLVLLSLLHDEPGNQKSQSEQKEVRWVCLFLPEVLVRIQLVTRSLVF